ncbi:metallophosphoesterase family protein [Paenibacillus mendelii]|uniref:Exonuclease SbcCD subunit D n=1 Tax=Paenibacillus mendelii TaxID=206163 RepID=A0ABV6JAU1_9BACL|nr:DNA repair exonuclease [Paenibacillus mendelii]MCQ6562888.1 DNA repair exonuclease [Paenibacillus mendelii]
MSVAFRFIHAADLHVDSPFRGLADAPEHVREALAESTFAAVRHLVDAALRNEVDFVVISGDLYDAADRSLRAQLALRREWERLCAQGVQLFVIHGNHDHLSGARASLDWPAAVTVFGADKVETKPAFNKKGELIAHIHGISYGARAVTENLAARYKAVHDGPYQIALLHGNVDGDASHDPYAPCALTELAASEFDYWALGHIHTRAVLHTYPHVVYPGNTQGRHTREQGAKGCYLVQVSASKETELTFLELDAVRFETTLTDIASLTSEQSLIAAMEESIAALAAVSGGRPLMLKLVLSGRGPLHRKLGDHTFVQELLEGLRSRFDNEEKLVHQAEAGWVWLIGLEIRTGAELDLEQLASEDSFAGELYRQSIEGWKDGSGLKLSEEALAPLLANPRLRKLLRTVSEPQKQQWMEQARELTLGLLTDEADSTSDLPETFDKEVGS